jgi:hypothetical protein
LLLVFSPCHHQVSAPTRDLLLPKGFVKTYGFLSSERRKDHLL